MDILTALSGVPVLGPVVPYLLIAGAICSALSTIVPPRWRVTYRVVNFVALNFGRARNATDPKAKTESR